MERKSNDREGEDLQIAVDIPTPDGDLLKGTATNDVLLLLSRNPDQAFSITDVSEAVDYSRPTISKTMDRLSNNDLVTERREGTRRLIQINRDRLDIPENPYFEIPQSDFYDPVHSATTTILESLDDVLAVVLYGSVARGDADRRSDIDLWVLVRDNRMEAQREANRVRQSLEEDVFNGNRYFFEIDVEGVGAVPNYVDEIGEILSEGIALYRTDEFETVRNMVMQGDIDE